MSITLAFVRIYFLTAEADVDRFVVGMTWKATTLISATIESRTGGTCRIRSETPVRVQDEAGRFLETTSVGPNQWSFETVAGRHYTLAG